MGEGGEAGWPPHLCVTPVTHAVLPVPVAGPRRMKVVPSERQRTHTRASCTPHCTVIHLPPTAVAANCTETGVRGSKAKQRARGGGGAPAGPGSQSLQLPLIIIVKQAPPRPQKKMFFTTNVPKDRSREGLIEEEQWCRSEEPRNGPRNGVRIGRATVGSVGRCRRSLLRRRSPRIQPSPCNTTKKKKKTQHFTRKLHKTQWETLG